MEPKVWERIKRLVKKLKVVYVATSNKQGTPHIAASEGISFLNGDRISFRAWFCLKTVENLHENPRISLALLDRKTQEGYQLLGEVERIDKGAILDGFIPGKDKEWPGYPQAEYQLSIRIKKISPLTSGPHSDEFLK